MISPLMAMVIASLAFFCGYAIGMFHTMYFVIQETKHEIYLSKEKYITLTHKVGTNERDGD